MRTWRRRWAAAAAEVAAAAAAAECVPVSQVFQNACLCRFVNKLSVKATPSARVSHDSGTARRTACNSEAPNSAVFHVATASNLPFWLQSRRCRRPGKLRRRRECQGGRRRPGGGQGPGEPARQWQQRCHVMSIFDIRPFCALRAALSVRVFRYDDRNTARRKTEIYTGYATQRLARPKHTAARSSYDL